MRRVCFTLQVKKELVEEYLNAHKLWPELEKIIKGVGVRNYSMFIRKDGLAVGCFEAEDPERSLRELGSAELAQQWEACMDQYFEKKNGTTQRDLDWLEEYFHLA